MSVVEGIRRENFPTDLAHYAFSNSGTLIYVPGPTLPGQQDLVLFDRRGSPQAAQASGRQVQLSAGVSRWQAGRV